MTDKEMITAIINAVQTDSNLLTLLKLSVAKNIVNLPIEQLQAIMIALNLPISN